MDNLTNRNQLQMWELFLDYWKTPVIQEMSTSDQIRYCLFLIMSISVITTIIDLISGIPIGLLMLLLGSFIKAIGYTLGMVISKIVISYFSKRKSPYSGISVGQTWCISLLGFILGYIALEPYRVYLGHQEHHGSESDLSLLLKISPIWIIYTFAFVQYHMKQSIQAELLQLQEFNQSLPGKDTGMQPAESGVNHPGGELSELLWFSPPGRKHSQDIDVNLITHINVIEHYCYLHYLAEGKPDKMEFKMPLKKIALLLPDHLFVQVNRSYIININYITGLNKVSRSYEISLSGCNDPISISRYRLSEVLPRLRRL